MKDDEIEPYRIENSAEHKLDKLPDLIDEFSSCELPEEPKIRKTVLDLQTHKCSKTCRKKGPECRFGFPRLPSKRTIIAIPIGKK